MKNSFYSPKSCKKLFIHVCKIEQRTNLLPSFLFCFFFEIWTIFKKQNKTVRSKVMREIN